MAEGFGGIYNALEAIREELVGGVASLQDTLVCISLGLNHADLIRLRRMAGSVLFCRDKKKEWQFHTRGMKENLGRDDAALALVYCSESVVEIESGVGNIRSPLN